MTQILSDEEVDKLHGFAAATSGRLVFRKAIRDAEAAILAKLASAELPEPAAWTDENFMELIVSEDIASDIGSNVELFTADQLRQAHAQGAAAQLSAEPSGWMDDFGNTFPLGAYKGAGSWMDAHKRAWKELYTRKEAK